MNTKRSRRPSEAIASENTALPSSWYQIPTGECIAVALLLFIAIAVRLAYPSNIAVEHFDEGVYASNIFLDADVGHRYPGRHLYAPPLLPASIQFALSVDLIFGSEPGFSVVAPIVPSLLAGWLTVLLVYLAGRYWFSATIGFSAALLAAFCDVHIMLSRAALTDALLGFWCMLAVMLYHRAARQKLWGWAVLAGVTTGLAWWTKYNGWLPLAITLSGTAGMLVGVAQERTRAWRLLGLWAVMAFVAVIVWFPCLIGLSETGGYAEVAANHRKYVHGISGWWGAAQAQFNNLRQFDSPLAVIGFATAGWFTCGSRPLVVRCIVAAAMAFAVATAGSLLVILLLSIVATVIVLLQWQRKLPHDQDALARWLLLAWFMGMTLATPMYQPYPRLMLTWLLPAWLMAAIGLAAIVDLMSERLRQSSNPRIRKAAAVVAAGLSLLAIGITASQRSAIHAYDSRRGMLDIASRVVSVCQASSSDNSPIILVYGEPALFYQICATGQRPVVPTGNFDFLNDPRELFLVVGPHAVRSDSFRRSLDQHGDRLRTVKSFAYQPSTHVRLNAFDGSNSRSEGETVIVYQTVSADPAG